MSILPTPAPARNGEAAQQSPWPDDTKVDFECIDPSPDPQHSAYEPTPDDWAEAEATHESMVAERCLNRRGMGLAELVSFQAEFYRSWGTDAGRLIGNVLAELAGNIRSCKASTVAEFEAQDELLVKWMEDER